MKERPILFIAPMVRALLDGSKTQTRRAVKFDDRLGRWDADGCYVVHPDTIAKAPWNEHRIRWNIACPYGQPGDRLWVRETFQYRGASYDGYGVEDADWFRCYGEGDSWDPEFPYGWEPSGHMNVRAMTEPDEQEGDGITGWITKRIPGIHMPRWASRITLEITGVRVERLHDISEVDAMAEGIVPLDHPGAIFCPAKSAYSDLWDSINGNGAWFKNPWVWVIEFKRVTP